MWQFNWGVFWAVLVAILVNVDIIGAFSKPWQEMVVEINNEVRKIRQRVVGFDDGEAPFWG